MINRLTPCFARRLHEVQRLDAGRIMVRVDQPVPHVFRSFSRQVPWVLPHAAHTFFWRLSHMIYDGVCADGSKLDAALHPSYRPHKECLAAIYNKNQTSDARAATATALTSHPGESSSEAAP